MHTNIVQCVGVCQWIARLCHLLMIVEDPTSGTPTDLKSVDSALRPLQSFPCDPLFPEIGLPLILVICHHCIRCKYPSASSICYITN